MKHKFFTQSELKHQNKMNRERQNLMNERNRLRATMPHNLMYAA